jgi:hypothetical protein
MAIDISIEPSVLAKPFAYLKAGVSVSKLICFQYSYQNQSGVWPRPKIMFNVLVQKEIFYFYLKKKQGFGFGSHLQVESISNNEKDASE